MIEPSRFLAALAQTLSTMALYKPGHPARERTIDRTFELLRDFLAEDQRPEFSFLGDEVIYGKASIRELRDWEWSKKFPAIGIQRLEFDPDVTREDFVAFLEEVAERVAAPGAPIDTSESRQTGKRLTIRHGAIGIRTETQELRKMFEK